MQQMIQCHPELAYFLEHSRSIIEEKVKNLEIDQLRGELEEFVDRLRNKSQAAKNTVSNGAKKLAEERICKGIQGNENWPCTLSKEGREEAQENERTSHCITTFLREEITFSKTNNIEQKKGFIGKYQI